MLRTMQRACARIAPNALTRAGIASLAIAAPSGALCMQAAPAAPGVPVAGANPFSAADLVNGNALLQPTVDANAAQIINTHQMDLFVRHIATLEHVQTINMGTLADLGLARGYHLATAPSMTLQYAQDILYLDAVPQMTDPGPQAPQPGGGALQAQALVHGIRTMVQSAQNNVPNGFGGLPLPPPMGLPPFSTAGTSTVPQTPRDMAMDEIQTLQNAFRSYYHALPPANELGDMKAFGMARHYCVLLRTYPIGDLMNYLKLRPDGVTTSQTSKVNVKDGVISVVDDGGTALEVSNATHHVEAFTRKANTILLVCCNEPRRPGQDGTESADDTVQISLDDVGFVLSILRENQRLVSKEAMAGAIVTFGRTVRDYHHGHRLKTLGASFKIAGETLRTLLTLKQTPAVSQDPAAAAAGVPKGDAATREERLKRQIEDKDRAINNLKNGRGRYNLRGAYRNSYAQNSYARGAPRGGRVPTFSQPHGGRGFPHAGGARGQYGGRGGQQMQVPQMQQQMQQQMHIAPPDYGPTGLLRLPGGNPQGETCPDWVNGTCQSKRIRCDRKHGY